MVKEEVTISGNIVNIVSCEKVFIFSPICWRQLLSSFNTKCGASVTSRCFWATGAAALKSNFLMDSIN